MKKLAIIDDESLIRNGISSVIQRTSPQWEVVLVASDANSALEYIRHNPVDFILVDIKMPQMTGIEMLSILKKEGFDILAAIISGYSEFNYAQKAIKLGVIDYLTKPISSTKLLQLLKRAEDELNRRESIHETMAIYHKDADQIFLSFLQNSVFGTINYSESDKTKYIEHFHLQDALFQIIILLLKRSQDINEQEYDSLNIFNSSSRKIYTLSRSCIMISFLSINTDQTFLSLNNCIEGIQSKWPQIQRDQILLSDPIKNINNLNNGYYKTLLPLKITLDNKVNDSTAISAEINAYSPIVEQTIKNISKNYNSDVSLTSLANMVYVHPIYLSNLFKKETGENISNYITKYRINKAKELLTNITNKIYDVAQMVGYEDPRYFGQVFKKHTGETPSQFREHIFLHDD